MSSGIPPTYYFNGITFNPSFYQSDEDYLTIKTARSSFLTYPMSQGGELFTSNITLQSTLTDSTGSEGTNTQILSSTGTGVAWIASNIALADLNMSNYNITNLNSITFFVLTIMKINLHHSGSPLRAFNVPSERSIVVGGSTWGMMEDI